MNGLTDIIPASAHTPCHACGRTHRKLYLVNGFWLGSRCKSDYELYRRNSDPNSAQWRGYKKAYQKIEEMVGGTR